MRSPEKRSMREAFGETVCELAREDPRLVLLCGDLSKTTFSRAFAQAFPERYFNVGIAEQNMASIAAGLASAGMIPLVTTFSMLLSLRALDQIRQSVAYPHLNVKLMAHNAGLSAGSDGPTHQTVEDLAIMRSIPNMTIIVPSDVTELGSALRAAVAHEGPVFFRMCRNPMPPVFARPSEYEIGLGRQLRPGCDVTVAAIGVMVPLALEAADMLQEEGISCRVLVLSTLKPLDSDLVVRAARETGALVTAEEHSIYGGLGSAVAECLVENAPVPMERVGLRDTFAESGDYYGLLAKYGLNASDIAGAARRVVARKR